MSEIEYCVYYDAKSEEVVDIVPKTLDADTRNSIITLWEQEIPRKILKTISEGELTMQDLRKNIGHSNSTLHENIKKLEDLSLLHTKIIYKGNKIRLLAPRFLFVTKSPRFKSSVQRFFQGLWVNSDVNEKVIDFLKENPDSYFTVEEISAKTQLSVDVVELTLSNWDSQATRALSDFMRPKPFEKKILYRAH